MNNPVDIALMWNKKSEYSQPGRFQAVVTPDPESYVINNVHKLNLYTKSGIRITRENFRAFYDIVVKPRYEEQFKLRASVD